MNIPEGVISTSPVSAIPVYPWLRRHIGGIPWERSHLLVAVMEVLGLSLAVSPSRVNT